MSQSKPDFVKNSLVSSLIKKLKDSLVEENDLLLFIFLSGVDPETLSVSALDAVKQKFELEEEEHKSLVGFFKTFSKDILKLRLHGIYNFTRVHKDYNSYPADFREKYSKQNFTKRYGHNLDSVIKANQL